jgi:hypothetical protein
MEAAESNPRFIPHRARHPFLIRESWTRGVPVPTVTPAGITADQLADRVQRTYSLNAYELSTWLHKEGLAELRHGMLTPPARCFELAELLSDSR